MGVMWEWRRGREEVGRVLQGRGEHGLETLEIRGEGGEGEGEGEKGMQTF
jgi:hypothetical protein